MTPNMKITTPIIVGLVLLSWGISAMAGGYHHNVTNNYFTTEVTNEFYDYSTSGVSSSSFNSGLAQMLAMDAIHCSTSTRKHQAGIGTGYSDGKNGFAAGYCKTMVTDGGIPVMIGGAAAIANGAKPKYSLGVNWTF